MYYDYVNCVVSRDVIGSLKAMSATSLKGCSVNSIEHGALMSPNPIGMLEDLVVGCVCVSRSI